MSDALEPLIVDFVEWIATRPRLYRDVMAAWRTSCPRLTVWEDSIDRGFVARAFPDGKETIALTQAGADLLLAHGRLVRPLEVEPSSNRSGAAPRHSLS